MLPGERRGAQSSSRKRRNWPRLLNLTNASVTARCVKHHGVGEDELSSLVVCLKELAQAMHIVGTSRLATLVVAANFRCSPDASSIRVPRTEAFFPPIIHREAQHQQEGAGVLAGPFRAFGDPYRIGILGDIDGARRIENSRAHSQAHAKAGRTPEGVL